MSSSGGLRVKGEYSLASGGAGGADGAGAAAAAAEARGSLRTGGSDCSARDSSVALDTLRWYIVPDDRLRHNLSYTHTTASSQTMRSLYYNNRKAIPFYSIILSIGRKPLTNRKEGNDI